MTINPPFCDIAPVATFKWVSIVNGNPVDEEKLPLLL